MDREQIEEDFGFLREDESVLAVLLFGSQATGEAHERSDIDICVVAPDSEPETILKKVWREVKTDRYDVHTFEEFSLKMKHQVIDKNEIIFCEDKGRLEEYFYRHRKIWNDQSVARGVI